jgi:hypothetical protein
VTPQRPHSVCRGEVGLRAGVPWLGRDVWQLWHQRRPVERLPDDTLLAAALMVRIWHPKPQRHRLSIATICPRPPLLTCLWARVKASVVCKEIT